MALDEKTEKTSLVHLFPTAERLNVLNREADRHMQEPVRNNAVSVYHQLFCLCVVANLSSAGFVFFLKNGADKVGYWTGAAAIAVSANFCTSILIRNEHMINLCFHIACSLPRSSPLRVRIWAARIYCYGGIHSGCAIAGGFWYSVFAVTLCLDPRRASGTGMVTALSTGIVLLLLMTILAFSHPYLRIYHHNLFESTHRFLGWALIVTLWVQLVLITVMDAYSENCILSSRLLESPSLWMLSLSTATLIYPWALVRLRSVQSERLSSHVIRIRLESSRKSVGQACKTVRLATSPLKDWHAFAVVPEETGNFYCVFVSDAGDWTRNLIDNPPSTIWIRESAIFGVTKVACLFQRVLFVATGSAIAPILPALATTESALLWITRNPQQTYTNQVLRQLIPYADRTMIVDSDQRKLRIEETLQVTIALYYEHKAEAIFVISNQRFTGFLLKRLAWHGIPAFGPIFDS